MSAFDGFMNVRQGHFAFFSGEGVAKPVILKLFENHEFCQTRKIRFQLNDPRGLVLRNRSPLRDRFVINHLWMNEVGVFSRILRHWKGTKLACTPNSHYESVRIEYLAPIFWMLILAHFLSFFIFVGEVFVKKFRLPNREI